MKTCCEVDDFWGAQRCNTFPNLSHTQVRVMICDQMNKCVRRSVLSSQAFKPLVI